LNTRLPAPKAGALPGCATPRSAADSLPRLFASCKHQILNRNSERIPCSLLQGIFNYAKRPVSVRPEAMTYHENTKERKHQILNG
jgi:hypothetical protein